MNEKERQEITQRQHEKLAKRIEESPLDNPVRDVLLKKLRVASTNGYATVSREFEEEMEKYRTRCLPSRRPRHSTPAHRPALILQAK